MLHTAKLLRRQGEFPARFLLRPSKRMSSSMMSGTNATYMEKMLELWKSDPSQVHKSWDVFFRTGSFQAPPTLVPSQGAITMPQMASAKGDFETRKATAKAVQLVRAYQVRGHFLANLDPLGLAGPKISPGELELSNYGFVEADLDKPLDLEHIDSIKGFLEKGQEPLTMRQLVARLKETYCGNIGYEYMHIPFVEQCNWLRQRIELRRSKRLTAEQKYQVLERLMWADHFESFLQLKWTTTKRFGIEGAESCIPGIQSLISKSSELGVPGAIFGMPHRGRLNVLCNVLQKPLEEMFQDFTGAGKSSEFEGSGDVKYHLGASTDCEVGPPDKRVKMHLSLLANPSHLEAVDPVVCGKVRAKQFYDNDSARSKYMSVLLHGDAAFAAQGVVYETFGFNLLPDYCTGGTIHVVVNNQIGFTTDVPNSRSSPYCTDVAKAFNAPIFHVNGDDPEAVCFVMELAAEWRATFKKDVVIDLVCYRRHGHNEVDDPSFTQPAMYSKIAKLDTTLKKYQQQLIKEGVVTEQKCKELSQSIYAVFEEKLKASATYKSAKPSWLHRSWEGLVSAKTYSAPQKTGVSKDTLKFVGEALTRLPPGFNLHKRLARVMENKAKSIQTGKDIDWATGEALAFGSLLLEGKHVRLSGQDVERGTFSHRHSVLHDQQRDPPASASVFDMVVPGNGGGNGGGAGGGGAAGAKPGGVGRWVPLNNLREKQAYFSVSNSSLSEYGAMGFELGYALEDPHALVLWEAQFGDFVNGAQIIMDQFLSSAEDKWLRQNGLVLLLPHGYEGQGPEHSSARPERFLQGMNDDPNVMPPESNSKQIQVANWQVVNCSTPANYFHVLRRQLYRDFRKTLVIMTPKSLLREGDAKSTFDDMAEGSSFQQVIGEPAALDKDRVKRLIFCSGKVYYDLVKARAKGSLQDKIAIARVEQLGPFPYHPVRDESRRFPKAEVVWVQEEPMNQGAWNYVWPRFETALRQDRGTPTAPFRPKYIGRAPSAATAAGKLALHQREMDEFITKALAL